MIYFMQDNGTVTAFDEEILGTLPQRPRFYASSETHQQLKISSLLTMPIWLRHLPWKLLPWVSMESELLEAKTMTHTAKNLKPGAFHFREKNSAEGSVTSSVLTNPGNSGCLIDGFSWPCQTCHSNLKPVSLHLSPSLSRVLYNDMCPWEWVT